jgi:hypothetical protein
MCFSSSKSAFSSEIFPEKIPTLSFVLTINIHQIIQKIAQIIEKIIHLPKNIHSLKTDNQLIIYAEFIVNKRLNIDNNTTKNQSLIDICNIFFIIK